MKSDTSVSLLIQGPFHENSIQTLTKTLVNERVDHCIVSTWDHHSASSTKALFQLELTGCPSGGQFTFVTSKEGDIPQSLSEAYPQIAHQVWSTLRGLESCTSKWVVKVRSDEIYDLGEFLRSTKRLGAGKLLTSNFIVREWNYHRFHISDHLFAVETNVLKDGLSLLARGESVGHLLREQDMGTPESIIGAAIFASQAQGHSTKSRKKTNRALWRLFRNRVQLFDLDSQAGSFEVHARRAFVGPVTALSNLTGVFNSAGLPIDFRHFSHVRQLRPRPKALIVAGKATRYLLRTAGSAWKRPGSLA